VGEREAAEWSHELEGRLPEEIVRWAIEKFGDGLVIGSSFGRDGLVLIDLARRLRPEIPVLFLETGYHFAETLTLRDELRSDFGVNVVDVRPPRSVAEQDAQFGPRLYERDPDRCCAMRKVAPLQVALVGRSAWMSGVRRDQRGARSSTPVVEWQELPGGGGVYKVNPLVGVSRPEVERYIAEHELPVNPLWARGFPSVGCAPCTEAVGPGEAERSGRWKGRGKTECGIHVVGIRRAEGTTGPEPA
jgi:phosphoadenosine phosphosulfate reductase